MSGSNAIEHVQSAETKAREIIEEAERKRTEMIERANEKAKQIIEQAESETKGMREDAIKKISAELESYNRRSISEAREEAKRIQKKDLNKSTVSAVVDRVIRQIFG